MDYGSILSDALDYTRNAVIGKWMQWLLLFIATLLLCIPLMGYTVRVFRGDNPAPEVNDWVRLIVDGIKYLIITLIYALPSLIILFVTMGSVIIGLISGKLPELSGIEGLLFGLLIFIVVAVICGLFGMIGIIRFARTGSMGEAFSFADIKETIAKIGWLALHRCLHRHVPCPAGYQYRPLGRDHDPDPGFSHRTRAHCSGRDLRGPVLCPGVRECGSA